MPFSLSTRIVSSQTFHVGYKKALPINPYSLVNSFRKLSFSINSSTIQNTPVPETITSKPSSIENIKAKRNIKYIPEPHPDATLNIKVVNEPVCEILIQGYTLPQVIFFTKFTQRTIQHLLLPLKGPYTLAPHVRRWTVLKSPFKYKRAQETFQRKTYKRQMTIYAASNDAVDKFIQYLSHVAPAGIGIQVTRYERDDLDANSRVQASVDAILKNGTNIELPFNVDPPKTSFYKEINKLAKSLALQNGPPTSSD